MTRKIHSLPPPVVRQILTSEIKSEEYPNVKYYWVFEEDYNFSLSINNENIRLIISEGFISDGGTIPRLAGYFNGIAFRSYLIHDFLYQNHSFSRKETDLILLEALKFESVNLFDRIAIYTAVRLFGSKHYKEV